MKFRALLLALASPALLAGCTSTSELVPFFDSFEGLPGLPPPGSCAAGDDDCCLEEGWCLDVETLSVRNVGTRPVTIESATFEAVEADPAGVDAFSQLEIEPLQLEPGEQASVRFRYTTPGGEAQAAKLVIRSDAEVNPELVVAVQTLPYQPTGQSDAGPSDDDAGPAADDAGPGDDDGGAIADAGVPADDAGIEGDAGLGDDDAGLLDDAGQ